MLPIPHPEFYVLYNGLSPVPEEQVITLSAAFSALPAGTKPALEL
ncbi:hypothetical protein FACS189493_8540 [Spirochaetia bacterium]|nr:hypothetical protein FACS189493_8540 [Spirochaetia bacterium]